MENNNEIDTRNIVSSVLSIAYDIETQEKPNRMPGFIFYFRKKNQYKELKRIVNKLDSANIPLDTENVAEYLRYLSNNYQPSGHYRSVQWVRIFNTGKIEGYVVIGKSTHTIRIENGSKTMHIDACYYNEKMQNVTSFGNDMEEIKSSNRNQRDAMEILNTTLINDIKEYLLENIKE